MVNVANLLNHLILVQSEAVSLIQGFGNLSAPPMVFSTPGKRLIYSWENKLMHRKLMPDVDTFALRPVNPGFSMDKMMATLSATLECEIREAVYSPNWPGSHPQQWHDERVEPPPVVIHQPMRSHLPPAPQFDRLGHQQLPAPPVVVPKWPLHSDFSPWPQKEIMRNQSKKRKSQEISAPQKTSSTKPENKRLKVEDNVVYLNNKQLPWLRKDTLNGIHLVSGFAGKMPEAMRQIFGVLQSRKKSKNDLEDQPSTVLYSLNQTNQNGPMRYNRVAAETWWKSLSPGSSG